MDQLPETAPVETASIAPPPVVPAHPSHIPLFIVIALIVVATFSTGVLSAKYIVHNTVPVIVPQPSPSEQPSPSPTLAGETVNADGTKTYTEPTVGFSITYPATYTNTISHAPISEVDPSTGKTGFSGSLELVHQSELVSLTYGDGFGGSPCGSEGLQAGVLQTIKINNQNMSLCHIHDAVHDTWMSGCGNCQVLSYGVTSFVFNAQTAGDESAKNEVLNILQSFTLPKQTAGTTKDTSTWKTFVSSQPRLFPVTFQYPSNLNAAGYADFTTGVLEAYIDTQAVFFATPGDGPQAPIMIYVYSNSSSSPRNYDEILQLARSNYKAESLKEEKLTNSGITGTYLSGTNGDGYMAGERMSEAIFDTPQGPLTFTFFGNTSIPALQTINETTFRSIVETVRLAK